MSVTDATQKGREIPNGSRMTGWDDGSKANVPSECEVGRTRNVGKGKERATIGPMLMRSDEVLG